VNDELGVCGNPQKRSVTQVELFETLCSRVIAKRVRDLPTVRPETDLAVEFGLFSEDGSVFDRVTHPHIAPAEHRWPIDRDIDKLLIVDPDRRPARRSVVVVRDIGDRFRIPPDIDTEGFRGL
jgi:hypothetical protein